MAEENIPPFYQETKKKYPQKILEVWFQDEARYGEKGRLTSVWVPTGTRPTAVRQTGFRNAYIFGAANAETGEHVGLVFEDCATDVMNVHLEMISNALAKNHHAILIVDGAGWHATSQDIKVPLNISLLTLPPYCPELNPVERIWLWIKDHHLSNIVIRRNDDIVTIGVNAWNKLTKSRVKSICGNCIPSLVMN